jgi:hypothetical protein
LADCVVLHIGLMKSGTTFLQGRLNANRATLGAQGVLFPGPTWNRHVQGVKDLMESNRRKPGSWAGLRDEINRHPGTAVVSMEYLAPMKPARIATLPGEFPQRDLRVVITVRDLGRSVPAMWQESVKNRQTWTWAEYLHGIEHGDDAGRRFWRQQDAARIARRWAGELGAEHVTVITIPPPGADPEILWDRFCQVAGIGPGTWQDAPRSNESLGAASTLVMRRLNEQTADLGVAQYKQRVKALAKHQLGRRKREEDAIGFDVPGWLRKESRRIGRQLEASGVEIVGGLDELEPRDVPGVDPARVSAEAERDAAIAGLSAVLHQVKRIK